MLQLLGIGLFVVYLVGALKFWKGYYNTNFNRSLPTRIALSFLWPILAAANPAYRKNFRKALKGR
jgi:hypothetical protein